MNRGRGKRTLGYDIIDLLLFFGGLDVLEIDKDTECGERLTAAAYHCLR